MPVAEPFNRLPFLGHAALFGCKWDKGFEERSRITFPCRQGGRREKTIDDEIWGLPRKFPDSIGRWLTVGLKVPSQPAWERVYHRHRTSNCLPLDGPGNCLLISLPDRNSWHDGGTSSPCNGCMCMFPAWTKAPQSGREPRRGRFRWSSPRWEADLSASSDFEAAVVASFHLTRIR